jgi:hypothetical protein
MASSTTQRMIDAGLLTKADVFDANWDKLMGFAQTIGNRGSWRTTPTPPPLDFAGPQQAYRSAMGQSMKQNLALKALKEREDLKGLFATPTVDDVALQNRARQLSGVAAARAFPPVPVHRLGYKDPPASPAEEPFIGAGKGVFLAPNVPQGGQIETPEDAAKWREIYSRRQPEGYDYPPDVAAHPDQFKEAFVDSGGFLGPQYRGRAISPGIVGSPGGAYERPGYDALARARGPGFMSPEAIRAAGPPRTEATVAEQMYNKFLPVLRRQASVPPALQGIPAALRPFTQKLFAANPKKGMDFVTKLLAAQTQYRPLKLHNVMHNGKPVTYTDRQLRAVVAEGGEIRPIPRVGTTVNVNKEKQRDLLFGIGGKALEAADKLANTAGYKLNRLSEMEALLETGVATGRLSEWSLPFKNMLAEFGVVNPDLPIQEAITSLGSQLALAEHGPGMGPMTDADFKIYQTIVPNIRNSPAGNVLIMHRLKRQYRGQQMYASVLYNKIKETGAQSISPDMKREAWETVAQRLNKELGPLVPQFKNEAGFEEAIKSGSLVIPRGGRVLVIGGKTILRELK